VEGEDMRVMLFQLVRELLFNVVKHAGVDEARVYLGEEHPSGGGDGPDGGGDLVLRVEDEGTGFDPATLSADSTGTGFGLPRVTERLRLFGGRLQIDSAPEAGTRCTVRVPLAIVHGD
jgi:signal transduction histidine kinase